MDIVTALALSIGLLGGVATYLYLSDPLVLGLQIWAAFIAWASFYHCGGKIQGSLRTSASAIFRRRTHLLFGPAIISCRSGNRVSDSI
jgi:hypothetical protein